MNCWVEINLSALRANFRAVQNLVGEDVKIIAVVKANAYGHGAIEAGRVFSECGAAMLAVTRLDEALELREAGISSPILLLAPALPDELDELLARDLTACVSCEDDARHLHGAAQKQNKTARAHLKINTGMGRLGVEPQDAAAIAARIVALPNLKLEAAWTHFAFAAEPDPQATHAQFAKFQPLVHSVGRAANLAPQNFHCANSAALLRFRGMRLSCVRPGTILYGQFPSKLAAEAAAQNGLVLRDGFCVKARIVALRDVKVGQSVGYGGEWRAVRPSRIATITIGFADGLSQEPNTRAPGRDAVQSALQQTIKRAGQWTGMKAADAIRTVAIRGARAPIIGRIAMQSCSIDVTDINGASVGDEVTVSMRRTSTGAHLPRVYVDK